MPEITLAEVVPARDVLFVTLSVGRVTLSRWSQHQKVLHVIANRVGVPALYHYLASERYTAENQASSVEGLSSG